MQGSNRPAPEPGGGQHVGLVHGGYLAAAQAGGLKGQPADTVHLGNRIVLQIPGPFMLQQTRVEAVKPFFERFLQTLPDIASLAAAEESNLLKLWEGLGYYNRARNLQKTALRLCQEYSGRLPADFNALLELPGIGRYTAGAVSSIAYGQRCPAVDGNVLRVITRLTACPLDILKDSTKRCIENALRQSMELLRQRAEGFGQKLEILYLYRHFTAMGTEHSPLEANDITDIQQLEFRIFFFPQHIQLEIDLDFAGKIHKHSKAGLAMRGLPVSPGACPSTQAPSASLSLS